MDGEAVSMAGTLRGGKTAVKQIVRKNNENEKILGKNDQFSLFIGQKVEY